jgi:hypothetical protein
LRNRSATTRAGREPGRCDVLVLEAAHKQSPASVRSLGQTGLRVTMAECFAECSPALPVPGFQSRYSLCNVVLPGHAADPEASAAAVLDNDLGLPTSRIVAACPRCLARQRLVLRASEQDQK